MRDTERDADFWHLPGTDDLAYIRAQPVSVVVRVLTPRGKAWGWRGRDVFSIWDVKRDDWVRNKVGSRRFWTSLERAEAVLEEVTL